MKKIIIAGITLISLLTCFTACERISNRVTEQPVQPEITIGVVLPLSGPLSAIGESLQQGISLAQMGHNKFNLIFEDDRGTAEGATTAFNKLIAAGVPVIIGPATSSAALSAFPIAQENRVVAISPTAGARGLTEIGDFIFRVALTTEVVVPMIVKSLQTEFGYNRVATIHDESDHFSTDYENALRESLTETGIEVVASEAFVSGDTDFSMQLDAIKKAEPDVVLVSALPTEKPNIMIQAHKLGINAPFFVTSLTQTEIDIAGAATEGVITFGGWKPTDKTPGNRMFVKKHTEIFGVTPNGFATASFVTFNVLVEAIANTETHDAVSIRDSLANIKDFNTVLGRFSFDNHRNAVYDLNLLVVKGGMLQDLD